MRLRKASKHEDKSPGGLADDKEPKDFNQKALEKGRKVEMEHTDSDAMAKEIAMDHLEEDPKYYDKLEKMEGGGKKASLKLKKYIKARVKEALRKRF